MNWQFVLALFFLSSYSFCSFDDFSFSNLSQSNHNLENVFSNQYNYALAQNSSITIPFGQVSRTLNVSVSFDSVGASTMYENSIYPTESERLYFTSGAMFSPLPTVSSSGSSSALDCNSQSVIGMYAWRCDFDNDGCLEFVNNTFIQNHLAVELSFKNYSVSFPLNSSSIMLPSDLIYLMKNSSGSDQLVAHVSGYITAGYVINDQVFAQDCYDYYKNYSINFPIDYTYSYPVLGTNSMFFLSSSSLSEQWFRNNRFDVVVLSQMPLSKAGYYLDSNSTSNLTLRHFDVVSSKYGLLKLQSNYTNTSLSNISNYSESYNLTTPIPISQNNLSYSYIYRFNYSYVGIGNHYLSFYTFDPFQKELSKFDRNISSRMLSYDGKYMENGQTIDQSISRPSNPSNQWLIQNVPILLGGILLILILSFVKFFVN